MDDKTPSPPPHGGASRDTAYEPPDVTILGTVEELTQKTVGGSDGATFQELDIS